MSITVQLELPEDIAAQAQSLAALSNRPLESELVALLSGVLGNAIDVGLSVEQTDALAQLQVLNDEQLKRAAQQQMADHKTTRMQFLLAKQASERLLPAEHEEVQQLRDHANLIMLVRAEAAALHKARGFDISLLLDD